MNAEPIPATLRQFRKKMMNNKATLAGYGNVPVKVAVQCQEAGWQDVRGAANSKMFIGLLLRPRAVMRFVSVSAPRQFGHH